ncbi:CCA tRNA nucleotidyltransferase [Christensenella intestinihominis]|uniref:CCA tRNA nucleotidyltransferase n=1 Tax=Christensenella intestinihominis TaxID=1851429 RepID=UPI000830BF5F|nr:HD domain-containing protein [Christensenella intestinihominis]
MEAHIERFFEIWSEAGLPPCYLVGGYPRNTLLGLAGTDLDLTSPAPPQALCALPAPELVLEERAFGLGTVVVKQRFRDALYVYEYTAFRCDNYGRGGAHTPETVRFTDDIREDALRRDFTVNALYMDADGGITDPTGRGLQAVKDKTIEQVTPQTLTQDALRILRMVRFAAELGFAVEPGTWECARAHVRGLADISKERIRDEFVKILMADTKYGNKEGVLCGLHMLKELGAFSYIVPALTEGDGMGQNTQYHAYDVMEHSLRTCACAPPDLVTRLAALLHDLGKPPVFRETGKMYGHDRAGAALAGAALRELRFDRETVDEVCALVGAHMFDLDNRAKRKAVVRMIVKLGEGQFLRLADVREADFCGSGMGAPALSAGKWRETLRELREKDAPLSLRQLAVNGDDVMRELHIPPGKRVGEILFALHAYALKKPSQNSYKNLIRYAKIINTRGNE